MPANHVPQRNLPFWMRPNFDPFEGCRVQPVAVYCLARQNRFRWVMYPGVGWTKKAV